MLNYSVVGEGHPVLLIHGFPLNGSIWTDFANELAKSFRVYTIDLPGFGKSPSISNPFTIDDIAKEILLWMEATKIQKCTVVGHSLGGYIALAMAELKPDVLSGLILFHSTAFADSDEKKENRNKVLEFIDRNGVLAFTSNFIPPLFANQEHDAIDRVRKIAIQSTADAVINYTKAMRDRPERLHVLKHFPRPKLIISGEQDKGISPESIREQQQRSENVEAIVLPHVAHMGMIEEPEATLKIVTDFITKSNRV